MSSRELMALAIENFLWMNRAENQNQSPVVGRLRSSQTGGGRGEMARRRLREDDSDPAPAPGRGGRRARDPSRSSGPEETRHRSRSPHRPLPDRPSAPDASPPRGNRSSGNEVASTTADPQPSSTPPSDSLDAVDQAGSSADPEIPPEQQLPLQAAEDVPLQGTRRPRRPSKRVRQIERLRIRSATGHEEMTFCAICQSDYEVGEQLTVLPCGHLYHPNCIIPWLLRNPLCPLCRQHCFQRIRRTTD